MSLRQIRRVQELAQANHGAEGNASGSVSESSEDTPQVVRKNMFKKLQDSESSSSSSSESEGGAPVEHIPAVIRTTPPRSHSDAPRKTPKQKKKQSSAKVAVADKDKKSVLDDALELNVRLLSPSSELRRIFGSASRSSTSGPTRPKRLICKRKHWLIEPEANWPLVVPFSFKMESCVDGSFRLVPENDYERKLEILARIVVTHDVEALYHFVELNPFNAHGLIQLASVLISQRSEYESAFGLVRRALYAYQSAFHPGFHPSKSVVLSTESMFSSSLLRAVLLYSHLLSGQGCVRTSLEVMKLAYAMDGGMIRGCPRTHALLHMDTLALKSGQYEWLVKFALENGLTDILPGYALGAALGLHSKLSLSESPPPETVVKAAVRRSVDLNTPPLTALLRAVSLFPDLFRQLGLEINISNHVPDPFTYKLIRAMSSKGGVDVVKSNEKLISWIKNVLYHHDIQKINIRRPDWLDRACGDITSTEFSWGSSGAPYTEPTTILNDETEIINMYCHEGPMTHTENAPTVPRHPVSLDSNPLAAFFQTLLPWATIDTTGTEAAPVTGTSLLEHLRTTLGMLPTQHEEALIQDRASDDETSSSESDDEEILME